MKSRPGLQFLAYAALFLTLAWWPFALVVPQRIDNGAHIDGDALTFEAPAIAADRSPEWLGEALEAGSLDLRLRAIPTHEDQFGPARLLSIGLDSFQQNLIVGQHGRELRVRIRRPGADQAGIPALLAVDAMQPGVPIDIEVTIRTDRVDLRVNGARIVEERVDHPMSAWDPSFELALGNEVSGDRAWSGRIELAEIQVGARRWNLLADGAIRCPTSFWIVRPGVQRAERANWMPWNSVWESLANILVFIPLGWLANRALRRRALWLSVAVSACVSITVEVGQLFFDLRMPSLLDLLANSLGGSLGAVLAARCPPSPKT